MNTKIQITETKLESATEKLQAFPASKLRKRYAALDTSGAIGAAAKYAMEIAPKRQRQALAPGGDGGEGQVEMRACGACGEMRARYGKNCPGSNCPLKDEKPHPTEPDRPEKDEKCPDCGGVPIMGLINMAEVQVPCPTCGLGSEPDRPEGETAQSVSHKGDWQIPVGSHGTPQGKEGE